MGRSLSKAFDGWRGLNTRASETGLPLLECTHVQDVRVVGKDLIQRKGIVHIGQLTGTAKSMLFNGTTQYADAPADTRVWDLLKHWTLEILFQPTDVVGTQELLGFAHATDFPIRIFINGNVVTVQFVDSAGTVVSLAHTDSGNVGVISGADVVALQLSRDGTDITMKIGNVLADSGTMADLNHKSPGGDINVARHNGGGHFAGSVCYLRLLTYAKTHHKDHLLRLPNPRATYVAADYDFLKASSDLVYDRSKYGNHLVAQNAPTNAAPLAHNPATVRGLGMSADEDNNKQLLMVAGGQYFLAKVA